MYPEAGGSSSFARRAFNEFWSFFAAWAQMLTYVATIATSAFFVPHYLGGLFWDELKPLARRRHLHLHHDRRPRRDQHRRRQGVDRRQRAAGGRRLPHAAAAGADRRSSWSSTRRCWSTTSSFGVAPTWTNFVLAIPIGMLAYTGIETVSNMSEEAKDEATTIPEAIARVRAGRVRDLLHAARGRAERAAGQSSSTASTRRCSACRRTRAARRATRCWAWSARWTSASLQQPAELYVGLLAATILFLATNAGLIGISRLVYSMGIHRQLPDALRRLHPSTARRGSGSSSSAGFAILVTLPGQAKFLGSVYSFGALLSFTMAHLAVIRLRMTKPDFPRPYKGPGNVDVARRRLAAVRDRGRLLHRGRVRGHRRPATSPWPSSASAWLAIGMSSTSSSAASRGST